MGAIIFTTGVMHDPYNNMGPYYTEKLQHAVSTMISFDKPLNKIIYDLGKFHCSVSTGSLVTYRRKQYRLLHCVVRSQSLLLLEPEQKGDFLRFIFNHLFDTHESIINRNQTLLDQHPNVTFSAEKFPLSSSLGLKMALKTHKIKICQNDPHCEPFTSTINEGIKEGSTRQCLITATESKDHGKPFLSRKSLLKILPEPFHQFFTKENCCYLCAYKIGTEHKREVWSLHVHHRENPIKAPTSLENQARLAVVEACLKIKRHNKNSRIHPYFK